MDPLEAARRHLAATPYELVRELGRGGMGAVFLARHTGLDRDVVVKLMHATMNESTVADRMRLEAQALARLRHPNVVEVLDFGQAGRGRAYLAMEYLDGQALDVVLDARQSLPVDEALHYAVQALDGLTHVHGTGVIHRDVKPANLFVLRDGRLKLLDFGVVKLMESAGSLVPIAIPTAEGAAVGTPKYMAPEQAAAADVDVRVDVYAVGTVLYEMVAGRTPFEHHTNMADMMIAQATETPLPPSRYASQPLPPGLDELIMKAIAKRRRHRFPNAAELATAIRHLQEALADPQRGRLRGQKRTAPVAMVDYRDFQTEKMAVATDKLPPPSAAKVAEGPPISFGPTGTVVQGMEALEIEDPPAFSPPPGPTPPPAPLDSDPALTSSRRALAEEIRAASPPTSRRRPSPPSRRPTTDRRTLVIAAALLVALSIAFGWLLRDVLTR